MLVCGLAIRHNDLFYFIIYSHPSINFFIYIGRKGKKRRSHPSFIAPARSLSQRELRKAEAGGSSSVQLFIPMRKKSRKCACDCDVRDVDPDKLWESPRWRWATSRATTGARVSIRIWATRAYIAVSWNSGRISVKKRSVKTNVTTRLCLPRCWMNPETRALYQLLHPVFLCVMSPTASRIMKPSLPPCLPGNFVSYGHIWNV